MRVGTDERRKTWMKLIKKSEREWMKERKEKENNMNDVEEIYENL